MRHHPPLPLPPALSLFLLSHLAAGSLLRGGAPRRRRHQHLAPAPHPTPSSRRSSLVAQQRAAQGAMHDAGGMRRTVEEELTRALEAKRHLEEKLRSLLEARGRAVS